MTSFDSGWATAGQRKQRQSPSVRKLLLDMGDYDVVMSEWRDGSVHAMVTGKDRRKHPAEIVCTRLTGGVWVLDKSDERKPFGAHWAAPSAEQNRPDDAYSRPAVDQQVVTQYLRPAYTVLMDHKDARQILCHKQGSDLVVDRVVR